MRRCAVAVAALLLATRAVAQPTVSDGTLAIDTVVTQLSTPAAMAFLASDDFLFLEKNSGRVRRVVGGVVQPAPVLDVAVNAENERGLLGIAINRESPPRVFLFFTEAADPDGDGQPDGGAALGNRVYRFTWNGALARLENRQLVLDLPVSPGPNHDGGVLVLGPTPTPGPEPLVGDGSLLYAVIGDLNRRGQLQNATGGAAVDDSGVILRVRQDGSAAAGNPFTAFCSGTTTQTCPTGGGCPAGQSCRSAVARYFAYGIRNSFGLAVDPVTGALWDTENGPGTYDEINRVEPGFNSGWTPLMGPDGRDAEGVGDLFVMPGTSGTYSDPEFSWLSPVAVTAIAFPSGGALGPAYDDVALVGDFNLGHLYRLPLNVGRSGFALGDIAGLVDLVADSAGERDLLRLGTGFGGIADLEVAPDGSIYVVSIGAGAIYRLRALNPPTPTPTATATPTPYAVSGELRYWNGGRPLAGAAVAVTGGGALTFATDATGAYVAAPLPMGGWTLTPRKLGGATLGVSALDAAYVLAHAAGLRPFAPVQALGCDASGNGTCTAFDAALILQLKAGLIARLPAAVACDSDWLFTPAAPPAANQTQVLPVLANGTCAPGRIVFAPLVGSAAAQSFLAVLLGDVTGNWSP